VWQRADDLFIELHALTIQQWPRYETYELGSQTRRSAYSVAANIVEGSARDHVREWLQFLNTARGASASSAPAFTRPTASDISRKRSATISKRK